MAFPSSAYKSMGGTQNKGLHVSFGSLCSTLTFSISVCEAYYFNLLFLLFSSSPSLLTFCVASQLPPTLTSTTPLGPTSDTANSSDPPTPPLKPTSARGLFSRFDSKLTIVLSVSAVVLLVLFLSVMAFLFKFLKLKKSRRRNGNQVTTVVEHDSHREDVVYDCKDSPRKYNWDDIERLTLNFSRLIGSGGFSNVYFARFPGSALAAVKIHIGSDRLNQVFKQELDILLRLRHDNIVKLLGYCDEREEGALVFEYARNGNLQEKLHQSGAKREPALPWQNRMAIFFQLAQAIEYLHKKCSLQIVHGDIKASNILLDEHLNCKLCDFGSAKMGFSSMVLPPSSRVKQVMMGSPGYTDPHYLMSGIASKKNDIYSLGVIILELVTGMEAFCPERGEPLTKMMAPLLRDIAEYEAMEKVAEVVDPGLAGMFDMEEARVMLLISALCLHRSPTLRPSATQILQSMKDKIGSVSFLFSPQKDPHLAPQLTGAATLHT